MESLKPILLMIVLSGIGYAVYVALNRAPSSEPALDSAPAWNAPVKIETGPQVSPNSAQAGLPAGGGSNVPPSGGAVATPPAAGTGNYTLSRGAPAMGAGGSFAGPAVSGGPSLNSGPTVDSGTAMNSRPSMSPSLPAAGAPSMPALISPGDASRSSPYGAAAANVGGMNGAGATGVGMNGAPAAGMAPGFAAPSQPVDPMLARQQHDFDTAMRRAQSDIQRNQLVDALRGLSAWYDHPAVGQRQTELDDLLSQLAGTVVYSREHWLEPAHVVQPGETLRTIADRQQVPWQLLAKINGIDKPESLVAGETLKVIRGPFNAQLNRGLNQLALFVDGLYAGQFAVQTSGDVAQLNGTFPVAKFAADAPSNSLRQDYISLGGNLFLRLADGTATPQTGTMQIQERDLRDVFDILSDRSQVTIRR